MAESNRKKGEWATLIVRVPVALIEEIEELIKRDLHQTKSEFVREAIRAYIYQYTRKLRKLEEGRRKLEKLERSER